MFVISNSRIMFCVFSYYRNSMSPKQCVEPLHAQSSIDLRWFGSVHIADSQFTPQ